MQPQDVTYLFIKAIVIAGGIAIGTAAALAIVLKVIGA